MDFLLFNMEPFPASVFGTRRALESLLTPLTWQTELVGTADNQALPEQLGLSWIYFILN